MLRRLFSLYSPHTLSVTAMSKKTRANKIVESLESDDEVDLFDVVFFSDDKSAGFKVLVEEGSFEFTIDGKGEKVTVYDQLNEGYEYDDVNLAVRKVRQYVSENNPLRDREGDIIREEGTGKEEALGKTAIGCLQLLPVVVALGLLIAIARACG